MELLLTTRKPELVGSGSRSELQGGLLVQFAANGAECADQSRAEQQQRAGLWRRASALMAQDVERAKRVPRAVAVPGSPTVGGIEIQAVYALVVPVPRIPASIALAHRTKDHKIRLTACEADSRNARDGDKTAAIVTTWACRRAQPEICDSGQGTPKSIGHLGAGKAGVVCPNAGGEGIGWNHPAYAEINLVNGEAATAANGKQVRGAKGNADGSNPGYCPSAAGLVLITGGAYVAEEG